MIRLWEFDRLWNSYFSGFFQHLVTGEVGKPIEIYERLMWITSSFV